MPAPESQIDRDLQATIATHGWAVINVAEEPDCPPFSYTIGLYRTLQHPELLVMGLADGVAQELLNVAGRLIRNGQHFAAGAETEDLLEGYSTTFRAIPVRQYRAYLGHARWLDDGDGFPALQLVYPDRAGEWPWSAAVSAGFRERQPILADTPIPPWAREQAN